MFGFENWTTTVHRTLDEAEQEQKADRGYGVIAEFVHVPTGCTVEFRHEPEAELEFHLICVTEGVEFEQEGRYETRTAGYKMGNRPLRDENPEVDYDGPPTTVVDGAREFTSPYPDRMARYPCPVCETVFTDDGARGWRGLHAHMHAHSEYERESAYADWGADQLRDASVRMWRERYDDGSAAPSQRRS